MFWNNDQVIEFIELYKKEQILWDPKHPSYRNKCEIADAWIRIQLSLGVDCSIVDLKKKKESLMTSFRMHVNRKKGRDGYQPSWFAYSLMESFLGEKYECDSSTIENEFYNTAPYNSQQTDQNINNVERSNSGRQYKLHSQQHQLRPGKSSPECSKKLEDKKPYYIKNAGEKRETDEYDLYGQLLAKKLRKLDEPQRDVTMHEIDNLMFRAKMQSSQRSYSSSPSPGSRRVKSPIFIVAPAPGHAHYEDENLSYQEHMQPPEPS